MTLPAWTLPVGSFAEAAHYNATRIVPRTSGDEPIRGVKLARLVNNKDYAGVQLFPLIYQLPHQPDNHAVCGSNKTPADDHNLAVCSCGFHAHPPDHPNLADQLVSYPNAVKLDVELAGLIVRGRQGWRASRQRILKVSVPYRCQYADTVEAADCPNPPVGIAATPTKTLTVAGWYAVTFCTIRHLYLPVCAGHAVAGYQTLADLASQFPTEWGWWPLPTPLQPTKGGNTQP